jgi:hypothetical protein
LADPLPPPVEVKASPPEESQPIPVQAPPIAPLDPPATETRTAEINVVEADKIAKEPWPDAAIEMPSTVTTLQPTQSIIPGKKEDDVTHPTTKPVARTPKKEATGRASKTKSKKTQTPTQANKPSQKITQRGKAKDSKGKSNAVSSVKPKKVTKEAKKAEPSEFQAKENIKPLPIPLSNAN